MKNYLCDNSHAFYIRPVVSSGEFQLRFVMVSDRILTHRDLALFSLTYILSYRTVQTFTYSETQIFCFVLQNSIGMQIPLSYIQ